MRKKIATKDAAIDVRMVWVYRSEVVEGDSGCDGPICSRLASKIE